MRERALPGVLATLAGTEDPFLDAADGQEQQLLHDQTAEHGEANPHTQSQQRLGVGQHRRADGFHQGISRATVLASSRFTSATSSFTVASKSRRSMMLLWLWM